MVGGFVVQLLKSRWPFGVLILAAGGYLSQHYRIDGLQHLKLKPVSKASEAKSVDELAEGFAKSAASAFADLDVSTVSPEKNVPLEKTVPPEKEGKQESPSTFTSIAKSLFGGSVTAKESAVTAPGSQSPLHIGAFHMQLLNSTQLSDSKSWETAVQVCSRFDVLAVQGISTREQDVLPRFVESMNKKGRAFDYMIGPRVGNDEMRQQFAFIFDTNRIETDRYQLYTVDDPHQLFLFDPLVAWFRAKGVDPSTAFTFTCINVNLDESRAMDEATLIPELTRCVMADGRQEDDTIILGTFYSSSRHLASMQSDGLLMALQEVATNVLGDRMLDNIVFPSAATIEYMGRSGRMDILREFNLSIDECNKISTHLPVWAEFSVMEGNQVGRIAPIP